ncbi:MAG TPA: CotH kinase family protein [Paludibacter sp.]|nr:CotH kinase family protein [Paludibacter sp.]
MKKLHLILSIILLLSTTTIYAITLTDSNLPIVIITTNINPSTGKPYEIPNEPKILASMKIIYRLDGTRNYMTDQNDANYLNYNGRIAIELRGSSSQDLPKKPYGLTTLKDDNVSNNNVSLLGMPKENDWVLNSLAFDPSLMRDYLSYDFARNMGNYSPRGVYCEVIVNGDYKGLYIFMEKLKINDDRINIIKMTNTDNTGQNVTGGYVTKCDKTTGGDPVAWSIPNANFIHDSPKPGEITTQQNTYIKNQFVSLKNVMTSQNGTITTGYPSIIDVPTFVDFMILNEFASNPDGYSLSTYFHKDRNGKVRAGPIWDFNLTYGNDLFVYGFDRSKTYVWQFNDGGNDGARFWYDLFLNTTFKCYFSRRWAELTAANQPLNLSVISAKIQQIDNLIAEAAVREQSRWNTISTHLTNVTNMKTWMQTRTNWLNSQLSSYQACTNVALPALVISKINYHPFASGEIESDSLEFIEITNNSNVEVNLTSMYFRELGLTYIFPANSTIAANAKIYIAASAKNFELIYGIKPFGQFTRNLSNDSEKLVLADAFGNIIDYVEYSDSEPWPLEADGLGAFLQLINPEYDNSIASNWVAASSLTGINNVELEEMIKVYPLPAQSTVSVYCNNLIIKSYEISDMLGRIVTIENNYYSATNTINVERLTPNIYFIKLNFENGESVVKKIIKR